jgi:hypothetical protein
VHSRGTLQTTENRYRKIHSNNIISCQLDGKTQSEELLSYILLTDIGLRMEEVRSVNGHSIFYSIANDIMNWAFAAFVTIDSDEDREEGDAKYN